MHRGIGVGGVRSGNVYDGKIAGLYDLEETLGRGHFAVVKLARHVFTGEKVAVKVIDKNKLDEVSRSHLFQEVRCMKLVQHPNVVRLYEVIDTQTKLYLILELGDGGDLYDYIMRHEAGLSEQVAREYFRQIVRAISYCHRLHVVHRDLKPENVVFFEKLGVVKLTDFGFSNKFCPGQKLETSCGSLAYSAPEILLGDSYDAPAVDVWSLGVILYMLVCGQAPFQEANDSETLTMIMDCKYTIPMHVSKPCKNLIARMLIREPERRATLAQIANDPWLVEGATEALPVECLPLVSRHQVSDDDHNLIIQKMVNGNIASKEEISEALDKNEYNHITATYFLLAERKLRAHRIELAQRKRPEQLSLTPQGKGNAHRGNDMLQVNNIPNPSLLSVPRTPGDLPQRARKCSIVQEEEDEEDLSSCSGREELSGPHCSLNRRGSRSEGKLNLALQERIAESERRRENLKSTGLIQKPISDVTQVTIKDEYKFKLANAGSITAGWHMLGKNMTSGTTDLSRPKTAVEATIPKIRAPLNVINSDSVGAPTITKILPSTTTTTILNEALTISIPIHTSPSLSTQVLPKYKTMPSPTRPMNSVLNTPLQLNEIFEEGDCVIESADRPSTRPYVNRNQNRTTSYEHRRSKFHKARTASCSSSDASDDDSESRKKRAHKLNNSGGKSLPGRRDSHDDSSDSQDQGGSGGTGGGGTATTGAVARNSTAATSTTPNTQADKTSGTNGNNNQNGGRQNQPCQALNFSRRHRNGRRRTGETRLRESQSLNRITEVQEDVHTHSIVISTTITATQSVSTPSPKTKSFGARLLQSWSLSSKKSVVVSSEKGSHLSRRESNEKSSPLTTKTPSKTLVTVNVSPKSKMRNHTEEKENVKLKIISDKSSSKKMRLLGRYFQVHKKLCIPLPGIFGRGRIYKAQSCSSLARDRISSPTAPVTDVKDRPMSQIRNSLGNKILGSDGDINQNNGTFDSENNGIMPLRSVCTGLEGICQIHLGETSTCCHLC